jgi:ribosomal-protein-alanine N-acetyltransferase
MQIIVTERLILSLLQPEDAPFILELVNEPDWLKYIGDRGVRNMDDARGYIERGPKDMYTRLGYGLYRVELKSDGTPIGLCGLIKRDTLPEVDIGFAFLKRYRGQGYAREAAAATLAYASTTLGLKRVLAITSPDNGRSIQLLEKLGFSYQESLHLSGGKDEVRLFALAMG